MIVEVAAYETCIPTPTVPLGSMVKQLFDRVGRATFGLTMTAKQPQRCTHSTHQPCLWVARCSQAAEGGNSAFLTYLLRPEASWCSQGAAGTATPPRQAAKKGCTI
eukprot:1159369-Pelagomonas_calceolata.AAC.9